MPSTTRQTGFTLIELVIVIVVLGILAAVAIPKFVTLQREARLAVLDSYYTTIKSGSNIVFAKMAAAGLHTDNAACVNLATGKTAGTSTDSDCAVGSQGVATVFGYPAANENSLRPLLDDLPSRWTFSGGTALLDGIQACGVTYAVPSAAGGRPTITKNETTTSGC